MRVIVNGEQREIEASHVDALLAELEYEGTHFAIAVNYDVVPRSALGRDAAEGRRRDRDHPRRGREGELPLTCDRWSIFYGKEFSSRLLIGTRALSLARDHAGRDPRLRRRHRHRVAAARDPPAARPAMRSGR